MDISKFQGGPAPEFGNIGMDENLSDGIGGGYPLIRYRGKVWSIQVRGDTYNFLDDKGYPSPFLDVIILRQAQNKSKAFFENYEEGSKDAPVCTSADGIVPDTGVLHKQSETCGMCPRNVFKPNDKGIKVKECGDAKRLSVIPMPAQTKKLLGDPLIEPVFLRVPAASLQGLSQMGDATKKQGYAYFTYVTRIDFDPEKSYPKMRFKAIQRLSSDEAKKILELRDDPVSFRIVGGDTTGRSAPVQQLAAPGNTGLVPDTSGGRLVEPGEKPTGVAPDGVDPPVTAAEDPAITLAALNFEEDRRARLAAIRKEAAELEAAETKPAHTLELKANPKPPATQTVVTGLGAAVQVTPQTPPASDTGEPETADAALDDAINALLPK
jgi:hypothetical protein